MKRVWLTSKQKTILATHGEQPIEFKSTKEIMSDYNVDEEFILLNTDNGNINVVGEGATTYIYLDEETKKFLLENRKSYADASYKTAMSL